MADINALLRKLPSVDELLRSSELREHAARSHRAATDAARAALERLRRQVVEGELANGALESSLQGLPSDVARGIEVSERPSLRRVINATGVILHTNLGRAPLSEAALQHLSHIASRYSNLEFDVLSGARGKRDVHADALLRALFRDEGDFATVVVNNNAAAVLLALNTLGEGGEVIVSRGELVEIGGSFRIPDVMSKSCATLREVGTTNRTRITDYERAINERTKLLLRVHRSNFEIVGFTEQPTLEELVALGRKRNIPVMEDLGSGALMDLRAIGVHGEPGVRESLRAGVDLVTYSGDKLLGGPQAGLISGKPEVVARVRSNALFRALRVDKLTYSVLEVTLRAYLNEDYDAIPALRMMRLTKDDIGHRAEAVAQRLRSETVEVDVVDGESLLGGGAAPGATLPTKLLALRFASVSANDAAAQLREGGVPVVARVEDDLVLIDLRTVFEDEEDFVLNAVRSVQRT